MSFQLPTLQDLLDRTRKAFRTTLPGSDAWIWPNNIYVSAKVIAGAVFEWFGALSYVSRMIFVTTAPDLETLQRHGAEYGISQKPAQPATGKITFTATGSLTVEVGAILTRTDGVQYIASEDGSLPSAGTLEIAAQTVIDGLAGNSEVGTPLTIVSGVTGDATAAVSAAFVGGADVEDIESFRARILFRKRNPPHAGTAADYVEWVGSQPGVSVTNGLPDVWVERNWNGAGTVRVFFLMREIYADGIPQPDDVARIQDYIETVRPVGAIVTVAAPTAVPVAITVAIKPNTTDVQEAATAELRDAFRRKSRVSGNDNAALVGSMPYLAVPATFSLSWIWQAIANAPGETSDVLSIPSTDTALTAGQIATLGTITFTT